MNDPHETMFNDDEAYPIWSMHRDAEEQLKNEEKDDE